MLFYMLQGESRIWIAQQQCAAMCLLSEIIGASLTLATFQQEKHSHEALFFHFNFVLLRSPVNAHGDS